MRIASSGVESVIAFVAIAYDRSAKVGSQYIHCGLIRSIANLKKYDVGSAKAMKVAVDSLEPPTSLVAMNDVSMGNLQLQNGCQAFGLVRHTLGRTDDAPRRKLKAECGLKETADFSKRHPKRVLQLGGNRNGVWPKSVICCAQSLRRLFRMRRLNSFHATWTNTYGDSKLGDNRYDRRKVGLKLAMYDHIGKFALAVWTWNCRNFNDTIDLVWRRFGSGIVTYWTSRLEMFFWRLLARGTYPLWGCTSFRLASLGFQHASQSLHLGGKFGDLFLKFLAAGTIRQWRIHFHRHNITQTVGQLKYQFTPGKHVPHALQLEDRSLTLLQYLASTNPTAGGPSKGDGSDDPPAVCGPIPTRAGDYGRRRPNLFLSRFGIVVPEVWGVIPDLSTWLSLIQASHVHS